tara:strand:- start:374 stop:610 length:237 start_codon:yes stop_codon:yes gene_type:complete
MYHDIYDINIRILQRLSVEARSWRIQRVDIFQSDHSGVVTHAVHADALSREVHPSAGVAAVRRRRIAAASRHASRIIT